MYALYSLELLDGVLILQPLVVNDEPVCDGQRVGRVALVDRLNNVTGLDSEFLEETK